MKKIRIVFFLAIALVVFWLGCNSILGIGDATFVPLPDGSIEEYETGPEGVTPEVPKGPVQPTRRVVRVPRGERSSFLINVDQKPDKPGNVILTAKTLATKDVQVVQSTDTSVKNQFKITLVASPTAANVDERLLVQAVTDQKAVIGTAEIRILVGTPGAVDVSFGNDAGLSTTIGAPQQVQFAVVGSSVLFVAEDNSVWDLSEDGVNVRQLFGLDTKGKAECGIAAIAGDPGTVLVTGFCPQGSEDFMAVGSRDADGGQQSPIEIVPQQDLFKIARYQDAGFYLAISPDSGLEVHGYPKNDFLPGGDSRYVPITVPGALIPGDGGVMVIGREEDPTHITEVARLAGTPFTLANTFGDGGIASTENADPATTETPVGAAASNGSILVATPIAAKILLQGYSIKGEPTTAGTIDGYSQVMMTADRHDRFVVGGTGADGKIEFHRYKADGKADDTFPTTTITACPRGQVGVDEDSMIVVFCPGSPASTARRIWP